MSVSNARLFNHIRDLNLKPSERSLALLIASYRNEETLDCLPLQTNLSRLTGLEQQHISKLISSLRKKKVLASISIPYDNSFKRFRNFYAFSYDWDDATSLALQDNFQGNIPALIGVEQKLANGNGFRILTKTKK